MKCRIHPSDSGAGVCACCLRERLSALTSSHARDYDLSSTEDRRNLGSSSVPPPILCNQPAFPKISRNNRGPENNRDNLNAGKATSDAAPSEPPSGSNSWLLGLTLGRKKKSKKNSPHVQLVNARGMSPAAEEAVEGGCARKPSPGRCTSTPSPMRRQPSPRSFSGLGRCLSPLMRPSPGTHRGQASPVTAFPGKLHGNLNRRCSGVGRADVPDVSSVLATNRSRKLVDLGKDW